MSKNIFLFLLWLSFFQGQIPTTKTMNDSISEDAFKCALPGPKNVHWTISGSEYVFFEWDPVPGAAWYRVKVFNYPSKTMIYSRLVTAEPKQNGIVVNDLSSSVGQFSVEVYSVCSNGYESPKKSKE